MLALVGALLWWRTEPARGSARGEQVARATESLSPSETLTPAQAVAAESGADDLGAREDAFGTSRAPVRGQLVRAEDGQLLLERKFLLLASAGNRVSETLTTDERGAFTSTRAFPRGELRAWVKDPASKRTLTSHAAEFDPDATQRWVVPTPTASAKEAGRQDSRSTDSGVQVSGRVIDGQGAPVPSARVRILASDGEADVAMTDDQGEFVEGDLQTGEYQVFAERSFLRSPPRAARIQLGRNELGDLVLPILDGSCSLRGRILGPRFRYLRKVRIEELASGARLELTTSLDEEGESFELAGLAPGRYAVALLPCDGIRYEPARLEVTAPATDLEFRAISGTSRHHLFEWTDAETGEPVRDVRIEAAVDGHFASYSGRERIPEGFDTWIARAAGYAPAQGQFTTSFHPDPELPDGELATLEVRLRRGAGTVRLALDAEALERGIVRPLPGVVARRGDLRSAPSGDDGLVWESLDSAHALRFELFGWEVVEQGEFPIGVYTVKLRRQSP